MNQGAKDMKLEGKVAIITGGGTGIGAAIAERFVADGAKICITGRRQEMLDKVAQSLPPETVKTCSADVSRQEDVGRMVETALAFGGGLHVVVNNAGMDQAPAGLIDIDPETWRKVLDVNLTGPFLLMKASIPHMIKAGGGSIINVSSLAGLRCIPEMPAYCASKGGLINLTQQAALDYGRSKVRCNVICPAAVRTDMFEEAMGTFAKSLNKDIDDIFTYFTKDVPLRRVAVPEEIAGICSYLASDDSSFMTGAVIPIDGGTAIVDISGAAVSNMGAKS